MILETFLTSAVGWSVVLAVLTTFELLNPAERHSLGSRVSGSAYWIVLVASAAALAAGLQGVWDRLGLEPLATLPLAKASAWAGFAAIPLAIVAGAAFHDFVFYWYHRVQHRWLWRWHAVHHSVEELNAVNSYHHVSEGLFALILVQVPTTLIVADTGPAVPFVNLALWLHIVWIHSPTRFNLGLLRYLFADNRFHRIHHSLEPRHFDKNFGAFTTVWDRLFGTCHMPAANEWPAVGLAEVRQPSTIREWWDLPARYQTVVASAVAKERIAGDDPPAMAVVQPCSVRSIESRSSPASGFHGRPADPHPHIAAPVAV